jgi:hypothetical protein
MIKKGQPRTHGKALEKGAGSGIHKPRCGTQQCQDWTRFLEIIQGMYLQLTTT